METCKQISQQNLLSLKLKQLVRWPFLFLIKLYQYCISPWLGNNCRHHPTCSHYAIEAIETHGIFKGLFLSIMRIMRCHPWHPGGYDPVPKHTKDIQR